MSTEQWQWTPGEMVEALTDARRQLEELKSLNEELRLRQERLSELLAPSEAALKARTEYLDRVLREQLCRPEQQVVRLGEELRQANEAARQQILSAAEALLASERRWSREARWRLGWSVAALFLGVLLGASGVSWALRASVPWTPTTSSALVERTEGTPPAPVGKPKPRVATGPVTKSGS